MIGPRVRRIVMVLVFTVCTAGNAKDFKWEVIDPDSALGNQAKPVLAIQKQTARWCSSVPVGPNALLTAAHCVENGQIELQEKGGTTQTADCWCPGSWSAQKCNSLSGIWSTVDLAVCHLPTAVSTTAETLSTDVSLLRKDEKVVLAGFGCISWTKCGVKKFAKKAQAGWARIVDAVTDKDPTFLTIGDHPGESALCTGDSGGPVFLSTGASRRVVGIGLAGCATGDVHKSEIVSLAADETVRWLCTWQKADPSRAINGLTGCP